MPNWVYNKVTAKPHTIKKLLDPQGKPTFTNIVPTPIELDLLETVDFKDSTIVLALFKALCKDDETDLRKLHITRKISDPYNDWLESLKTPANMSAIHLINLMDEQYNVTNWYDFNCKYYGCKWDASNEFGDYDLTNIPDEIEFLTPWSPPEGVISKLAETDEFDWHCDEESCAFSINFHANGDGSYNESDDIPIYYTPYIPQADELEDYTQGLNNLKDVKETVFGNVPKEALEVTEDTDDIFSVIVFDPYYNDVYYEISWDKNGQRVGDD